MIQNITKGARFGGLARYVHEKEGAERIAGNMAGRTPSEMEREWKVYREMNGRVEKDVAHVSLSLADGEQLTNEKWEEVAATYIEEMGFDNSAWVAYRHQDTNHDHIHIVAHRVDFDGKAVDMWKDYARGEEVCRQLEEQHDLQKVAPSREAERAAPTRAEAEMFKRTGEISVKMDMQARVESAARTTDTMKDYADTLEAEGVSMQLRRRQDGQPYGVVYVRSDGEQMKGSDLGRAFSWGGLQKKAGITYEYERDDAQLRQSEERARAAIKHAQGRTSEDQRTSQLDGDERRPERANGTVSRPKRASDRAESERPAHAQGRASGPQPAISSNGDDQTRPDRTTSPKRVIRRTSRGTTSEDRKTERGPDERNTEGEPRSRPTNSPRVIQRRRNSQENSASSQDHRRDAQIINRNEQGSASRDHEKPSISDSQSGRGRGRDSNHNISTRDPGRSDADPKSRVESQTIERTKSPSTGSGRRDLSNVAHLERGRIGTMEDTNERRRDDDEREPTKREVEEKFEMPAEFVEEWFQSNLSEEAQREIWKEEQITQRLADGQTYEKDKLEGEIVDMQTIGDKTTVLVEKGDTFTLAEVDREKAQILTQGDHVKVKGAEVAKSPDNDKSKQIER